MEGWMDGQMSDDICVGAVSFNLSKVVSHLALPSKKKKCM